MFTSHSIRQLHKLCSSLLLFSTVVLDGTSKSPVLSTTLGVNEAGNSESDGGGKKREKKANTTAPAADWIYPAITTFMNPAINTFTTGLRKHDKKKKNKKKIILDYIASYRAYGVSRAQSEHMIRDTDIIEFMALRSNKQTIRPRKNAYREYPGWVGRTKTRNKITGWFTTGLYIHYISVVNRNTHSNKQHCMA